MARDPSQDLTETASPRVGRFGGSSFFGSNPVGARAVDPLPMPRVFPNGATAAGILTFDVEGRYGNSAEDMDQEIRNYDRIGPRMAELGIKGTFNIVGQMARDRGPAFVRTLDECGCEIASHGFYHELQLGEKDPYSYHGHYGLAENLESLSRSIEVLSGMTGKPIAGVRLPYAHLNEYSYEAIERLGLSWASNFGIDDMLDPSQGFGPAPFRPALGERVFDFVEIPLDTQTYDWAIWIADENNPSFIERVRRYAASKQVDLNRTPAGAVEIWRARIRDAMERSSCMTLLCHPINLTARSDRWGDAVDEFLFPIFEELAALQKDKRVWVPLCREMAEFYRQHAGSAA